MRGILFSMGFLIGGFVSGSLGCTSVQLQRNSNRQLNSLADLHDQQVLDNLARFVVNPSSTPSFAVPAAGISQLTDTGGINGSDGLLSSGFWSHINFLASRSLNQSWDLRPVTEPKRLLLMKCAYQRAVGVTPDDCLDCCKLESAWYGPSYDCNNPCGITSGWVRCSKRKKDVPKCCVRFSYFCDTYVWVEPCQQAEFSRLVMRIVDYASGSPYEEPEGTMKEVIFYFKADGSPGTIADHFKSVRATVEGEKTILELQEDLSLNYLNDAMQALLALKEFDDVNEQLKELRASNEVIMSLKATSREEAIQELEQKIESKANQLKTAPAASPRRPNFGSKAIEGTGSILGDQQRLNTLQPTRRPR
jgi:hypothetical protein